MLALGHSNQAPEGNNEREEDFSPLSQGGSHGTKAAYISATNREKGCRKQEREREREKGRGTEKEH